MSQQSMSATPDEGSRMEPGLGLALLTVLVMLGVTAILAGLIYLLMVAISPIDQRRPGAAASGAPAAAQQAPAAQSAQHVPPVAPAPAQ